jgi:hypothetical protein
MGIVTVRWTITCLVMASTSCFSKPERPPEPIDDGGLPATPRIVGKLNGQNVNTMTMTLTLEVPPGDARFLLAAVHAGKSCTDAIPTVLQVDADGTRLTPLGAVAGTVCGTGSRSEHWALVAPPVGTVDVTFQLDGPATSLHAMAIVLDDVDQVTPVRGSETNSGQGTASSVMVDSGEGDLVIDTVGQGGLIMGPGSGQDVVLMKNMTASTTLDNSGASKKRGVDGGVTMVWNFDLNDEWQTVATSIRPR